MRLKIKEEKLKPCPFCGGNGKIERTTYGFHTAIYILCSECRARTKTIIENTDYCAADEAIKLWNQRAEANDDE